jgi:hypothetical protein
VAWEEEFAIRRSSIVTFLCALLLLSPFILLVGGGIAMCFLYAPGERLDARGYWILAAILIPYFLLVLLPLACGDKEEQGDEEEGANDGQEQR